MKKSFVCKMNKELCIFCKVYSLNGNSNKLKYSNVMRG